MNISRRYWQHSLDALLPPGVTLPTAKKGIEQLLNALLTPDERHAIANPDRQASDNLAHLMKELDPALASRGIERLSLAVNAAEQVVIELIDLPYHCVLARKDRLEGIHPQGLTGKLTNLLREEYFEAVERNKVYDQGNGLYASYLPTVIHLDAVLGLGLALQAFVDALQASPTLKEVMPEQLPASVILQLVVFRSAHEELVEAIESCLRATVAPCSAEELARLKARYDAAGEDAFPLELSPGFEAHYDELKRYRQQKEAAQEALATELSPALRWAKEELVIPAEKWQAAAQAAKAFQQEYLAPPAPLPSLADYVAQAYARGMLVKLWRFDDDEPAELVDADVDAGNYPDVLGVHTDKYGVARLALSQVSLEDLSGDCRLICYYPHPLLGDASEPVSPFML